MFVLIMLLVSEAILVATTYASPPTKTPVATCCPPGTFLAIEDWQESRQLPNGLWTDSITFNSMEEFYSLKERQITPPMWIHRSMDPWSFKPGASDNVATMSDYNAVSRYGRHNYILGVSCVPDKNNLHPIDGFRGSFYPDPPYFASLQDKLLGLETRKGSKPLADSQILQSTGDRLPSCPGGPNELSTIILGDGRSSSFGNTSSIRLRQFGTSPFLRINEKGELVGKHLDYFGSTDSLRLGMHLPRRFRDDQSLPVVEETELGVDFCLTWSTDPRTRIKLETYDSKTRTTTLPTTTMSEADLEWEFIQSGPTNFLEAVYCDPCKAKVLCYFLTTNFLPSLAGIFDPVFWAPDIVDGPAGSRGMDWWVTHFPSYLDADRDGKSSIQEFYDVKVVQVLRIIFAGLDVNGDSLVKRNEAHLESFFRPIFLRGIAQELFDFLDKNNDNQISVADITPCEIGGSPFCPIMAPLEKK